MELIKTDSTQSTDTNRNRKPDVLCNRDDSGHGGNIYKVAEETGISRDSLIDFSASINPLGISDRVKDVIHQELDNLVNYPDPDAKALTDTIAAFHGIDSDSIICGNGSTELIYLMPRVFNPNKVLITAPAFSEYERACKLNCELRITNYDLREDNKFNIDPDMFIERMQGCDMAFLCNPNNPTGDILGRDEVLRVARAAAELKCLLVVDEAFIDFSPGESVIKDVQDNQYLIVLRSMTKFHAITGLRIGYAVLHRNIIENVRRMKEPWTVNTLAQKAAIAAITDSGYSDETYRLMEMEKEYLENSLSEMGVKFFPSAANYYLLKVNNATRITAALREKGILVRDCSNFKGLDGSYIRIAVKSHKHNAMLIKELEDLCRA